MNTGGEGAMVWRHKQKHCIACGGGGVRGGAGIQRPLGPPPVSARAGGSSILAAVLYIPAGSCGETDMRSRRSPPVLAAVLYWQRFYMYLRVVVVRRI
eukprot:scaffold8054_cov51-Isochrysis_galbana.AAC.1